MNQYLISESDRQEIIAALEATGRDNRLAYGVKSLQPSQAGDAQDAARYRWLRDNVYNVSYIHQVNPYTKASVMGLHCGSLTDSIDAAINAKESK